MMTHEERTRFVRQQIALARMGGGASGTGADVAQRIVECWETDLNALYAEEWHGTDATAPKVTR